jgi:hypothetical protein
MATATAATTKQMLKPRKKNTHDLNRSFMTDDDWGGKNGGQASTETRKGGKSSRSTRDYFHTPSTKRVFFLI